MWRLPGGRLTERLHGIIVDAGSTSTSVSPALADRLGIEVVSEMEVDTAAGVATAKVGSALIRIGERVATVPLFILKELPESVIGLTTLEALGYKVNPITQKLEPERPRALSTLY